MQSTNLKLSVLQNSNFTGLKCIWKFHFNTFVTCSSEMEKKCNPIQVILKQLLFNKASIAITDNKKIVLCLRTIYRVLWHSEVNDRCIFV